MRTKEDLITLLERRGVVCSNAQEWIRKASARTWEQLYAETPYHWLLWLYQRTPFKPREDTDRILRMLLEFSPIKFPQDFVQTLRTRNFNDTRWTTQDEWRGVVRRLEGVERYHVLGRVLLRLHDEHRSNRWLLFDVSLLALKVYEPSAQFSMPADQQAFADAFRREYPYAEMLERWQSAK